MQKKEKENLFRRRVKHQMKTNVSCFLDANNDYNEISQTSQNSEAYYVINASNESERWNECQSRLVIYLKNTKSSQTILKNIPGIQRFLLHTFSSSTSTSLTNSNVFQFGILVFISICVVALADEPVASAKVKRQYQYPRPQRVDYYADAARRNDANAQIINQFDQRSPNGDVDFG